MIAIYFNCMLSKMPQKNKLHVKCHTRQDTSWTDFPVAFEYALTLPFPSRATQRLPCFERHMPSGPWGPALHSRLQSQAIQCQPLKVEKHLGDIVSPNRLWSVQE